jgi:transcriptional regulator with XRE-family HTH domain
MEAESTPDIRTPSDLARVQEDLGTELARLRHEQKMTGQALAEFLGLSQSTISKIENGLVRPSPADVERIAVALGAASELTASLVERAVALQARPLRRPNRRKIGSVSGEARPQGVTITSEEYAQAEVEAARIRNFEPIIVPGLLQISEYARRIVNGYHRIALGGEERSWYQRTASLVTLRMERQKILYDTSRAFDFVLMESVLGNRFAPPEYMIAQIRRIAAAAELENVTVRIVPSAAELKYPLVQGFEIMGDDMVVVETLDAAAYRDPELVRIYSDVFEEYAKVGDPDLAGILAGYTAMYAKILAPGAEADVG